MESISEHITFNEAIISQTASRYGLPNIPNAQQLKSMKLVAEKIFEPAREWLGEPIFVSSFFRSKGVNIKVGGSATSQHCKGEAIDLYTRGNKRNKELFNFIKDNLVFDQLIYEFGDDINPNWIHVSYSKINRGQVLRAKKLGFKTVYLPYFESTL